jgi:hypothetical protein
MAVLALEQRNILLEIFAVVPEVIQSPPALLSLARFQRLVRLEEEIQDEAEFDFLIFARREAPPDGTRGRDLHIT